MARNRLLAIGVIILAAIACTVGTWLLSNRQRPVSLLLITLDTTRADRLGCYGYSAALTPYLDRISAEGVSFDRALCSAPMTLPSHATMLTGLAPPEHSIRVNGETRLAESIPTLATVLQENGYQTAAFIAAFALDSKFGLDNGFAVYDDDMSGAFAQKIAEPLAMYRPGSLVVHAALQWLEEHADEPFFCWVHLYDPHLPYHPHRALLGTRYYGQPSYDAEIAFMDMQVGHLMRFLQERRLRERTLVVAVGDHGEGLGDHGESDHGYLIYDTTLQVPLIISQPGRIPQGARTNAQVGLVNLLPTLLELLEIPQPKGQAERSFLPALSGSSIDPRPLYAETDQPYASFRWAPLRAFITDQWKYIRSPRHELYDRARDPTESNNLAAARPEVVAKLEAALTALENQMTPRHAEAAELTDGEIEHLESLGYVASGRDVDDQMPDYRLLPDIKDRLIAVDMDRDRAKLMADGKYEQAVELCRQIVAVAPESMRLRYYLGEALEQAGRLEEAAQAFRETTELDPSFMMAQKKLALTLTRLGRLEEAFRTYRQALKQTPWDSAARNDMAAVLILLGRLDEAADHLRQILAQQPNHADAYFNLARVHSMQKDYPRAVACYQQALQLNPDRVEALNATAWILATVEGLDAPDTLSPVQLAQRACELTGYRQPAVLDTLAAAYAHAGMYAEAVSTAQRALDLATSAGQAALVEAVAQRLELYKSQRPFRQPP